MLRWHTSNHFERVRGTIAACPRVAVVVGGDVQTFGPSLASELGGFQDGSGGHL